MKKIFEDLKKHTTKIINYEKKEMIPLTKEENKIHRRQKKAFYSSLNMENITDIDYRHVKRVSKKFKLKNLGVYHDLFVQSDTLLLADVFENFRYMCIEVYELDPAHFLSAPGLAWQACLKIQG